MNENTAKPCAKCRELRHGKTGYCKTHWREYQNAYKREAYYHGPAPRRRSDEERFFSKVVVGSGCWTWTAAKTHWGYGNLSFGGVMQRAHRVAWMLFVGPIPPGMLVLHRCDNPPCVNPDHLFLGTQKDNVRDMYAKNRGRPCTQKEMRNG